MGGKTPTSSLSAIVDPSQFPRGVAYCGQQGSVIISVSSYSFPPPRWGCTIGTCTSARRQAGRQIFGAGESFLLQGEKGGKEEEKAQFSAAFCAIFAMFSHPWTPLVTAAAWAGKWSNRRHHAGADCSTDPEPAYRSTSRSATIRPRTTTSTPLHYADPGP